jgi:hypothetical protein
MILYQKINDISNVCVNVHPVYTIIHDLMALQMTDPNAQLLFEN